jgi:hypothetical protein
MPPELMTTPLANQARELVSTTLMAMAPAIETELPPSSLLAALGVEPVLEVLPVSADWVPLAWPRLSSAFWLTSLPPPPLPSLGEAPFAEASAVVVVSRFRWP